MMEGEKRVRKVLAALIIAGACAGVLPSCSEDPTEDNSLVASLPFTGFRTQDTILTAMSSRSERLPTGMDGVFNLIGQFENYRAYTAIQVYPSAFPARDTILVLSATLRLRAATWYGSANAPFAFTVHRIIHSWTSYTLTWDSVQTGFYEPLPRGQFSVTSAPDSFDIVVDLDTSMVREWFATSSSTTNTKYGIVLVPDPSTTNCVRGVYGFGTGDTVDRSPLLTVIAGNTAGVPLDTTTYASGQDTFVGTDDHPGLDPSVLTIQAGVNFRSAISFDLSAIPRGSIVNRAEMILTKDDAGTRLSRFLPDTAISAHILYTDSSLTSAFSAEDASTFGRPSPGVPSTFTFDIRTAAQSWLRGPNYGVLLRFPTEQEYSTPELISFYGATTTDPARRPRLKILYSIPVR